MYMYDMQKIKINKYYEENKKNNFYGHVMPHKRRMDVIGDQLLLM